MGEREGGKTKTADDDCDFPERERTRATSRFFLHSSASITKSRAPHISATYKIRNAAGLLLHGGGRAIRSGARSQLNRIEWPCMALSLSLPDSTQQPMQYIEYSLSSVGEKRDIG